MVSVTHRPLCMLAALLVGLCAGAPEARAEDSGWSGEVSDEIGAQIEGALPFEGAEVRVESVELGGVGRPRGAWSVTIAPPRRWGRGRIRAKFVDEARGTERWVRAQISVQVRALVATERIERGDSVSEGRGAPVAWEMVDLEGTGEDLITPDRVDRTEGMVARRVLVAGRPVGLRDLWSPVLIKRGSVVEMIVQRGAVRVRDRGVAVGSGRRGDMVRVVSQSTQKSITCIIMTDTSVMVP